MSTGLGLEESYRALAEGVVQRRLDRDVVRLRGPEARSYLQGQCTQDVAGLAVGESRWALLLSVQGKVEGLVRVTAVGEEELLLDTEAGQGPACYERLRRFKIRVKAELEQDRMALVELRGPACPTPEQLAGQGLAEDVLALPVSQPGLAGVDLLGREVTGPEGVPEGAPAAFEVARIEAGLPRMGSELDASTIPFEAGIVEATVSFTKGCYTGQELVARLEARGARVPRRLRGVVLPPGPPDLLPTPGDPLRLGEKQVGALTSVAWSPRTGSAVALAYVQRAVEPPAQAVLVLGGSGAGELPADIRALPLGGGAAL